MEVSSNVSSWYKTTKKSLSAQKKAIHNNQGMPDRYQRYREVVVEEERVDRWYKACSTSSSPL